VAIENKDCDIRANNIETSEGGCLFEVDGKKYSINIPGVHNVYNALVAIAVGRELGIDDEKIKKGLESYHSDGIRQNIISIDGYKIINDCYNSSPQSVKASLGVLETLSASRRIAVLGDIKELGSKSEELHREVGKDVNNSKADVLITVGEHAKFMADEARNKEVHVFETTDTCAEFLKGFLKKDDAVLIKASRSMKFETISQSLM
jgi:UDP-N-acetylmuramoyl-tripeptide--D-alanyl-D-alanine ligase